MFKISAITKFRKSIKPAFLQWTPLAALVFGVSNIITLSVAHALHKDDMTFLAIGAGGLVLLMVGLWPVRHAFPHILGIKPSPFTNKGKNENRPT